MTYHSFRIVLSELFISFVTQAIIDIDGNNWSARFNSLLCGNSVVIKIQPDFIEQSYKELQPFVHYIPATISNLTVTVDNILDVRNDSEMKETILNANEWCRKSMNRKALADAAVDALEHYQVLLAKYDITARRDDLRLTNSSDLVHCQLS